MPSVSHIASFITAKRKTLCRKWNFFGAPSGNGRQVVLLGPLPLEDTPGSSHHRCFAPRGKIATKLQSSCIWHKKMRLQHYVPGNEINIITAGDHQDRLLTGEEKLSKSNEIDTRSYMPLCYMSAFSLHPLSSLILTIYLYSDITIQHIQYIWLPATQGNDVSDVS